jgi:hypothetical protein
MHLGPVLIDAFCDIGRGVEVIVRDNKIPAECLGKKHQRKHQGRDPLIKHPQNLPQSYAIPLNPQRR